MKKITNKKLQAALLRGAVLVSGYTATVVVSLFFDSIYGIVTALFIGGTITTLIDEAVFNLTNK